MNRFETIYKYGEDGFYCGEGVIQRDKNGEFQPLQENYTFDKPEFKEGFDPCFKGGKWTQVEYIVQDEIIEEERSKTEKEIAIEEIRRLEAMMTPRAIREAKRANSPVKGYAWNSELEEITLVCEDVEAEIERIETEVLGR